MIALIYDKTLTMQAGIADESRSLTLMGTDIDRLVVSLDSLCEAVPRLIELSIGVWLLAEKVGWPCVAPIVLVISKYLSCQTLGAFNLTCPSLHHGFQSADPTCWRKTASMGCSNSAQGVYDFFNAGVYEERQDDGLIQHPDRYTTESEISRA